MAEGTAGLEHQQVVEHRRCVVIALFRNRLPGAQDDFVELQQELPVGTLAHLRGQPRKLLPVEPGCQFVKQASEGEHVGGRLARTLRRQEALRADIAHCIGGGRHQTDVGQLGHAAHQDDVRRFDVAVHQAVGVQPGERPGELDPEGHALRRRQPAPPRPQFPERERPVFGRVDLVARIHVVGELHHVVEEPGLLVLPDMQQRELPGLRPRHRGEPLQAAEFPLERSRVREPVAPHDLDRPIHAR